MVQGVRINKVTVGGVTVSVWTGTDPAPGNPPGHHPNFKVDIGAPNDDDWVCVGGGGTGHMRWGNYITASFPSDDFKSWNVSSQDHIIPDRSPLVGYAIGMRIEGLSKDELISNLKIFKDTGASVSSPERACFVGDGLLLLGGGFRVLDQPPGGGNFATGSFPDSNVSWRARSKDHEIPSPSPITVFAIGINPTLRRADGSVFGDVVTTYHSFDLVPGGSPAASMVRPLPGFALCGGGAVTHYWYGMLIWALEPTTKPDPITELDQSFTGRSVFGTNKNDNSSITAYAMGIKLIPTTGPRPGEQCDIPIPVTDSTSDVTLNPAALPASNVMDGNLNTKWMSKVTQNPSIRLSLRDRKPVCKVDIAWGEGNVRKYKFIIELSTDNQNWLQGASGQSTGNTTAYESYAVTPTPAQYIRITVTDSALGTSSAQAQILEVKVFSDH